ncbi:MAG: hypothetical protein K2L55_00665 [Muribaculaceae bacterium]|nr:hypothetical protein [Muribaculaceae bacterium]
MATENLHFSPLYIQNAPTGNDDGEKTVWVVMRSRKEKVSVTQPSRGATAAKAERLYGYELAQGMVRRFFMPMKESVTVKCGRQVRKISPAIPDIFFVNDTRSRIDSIVRRDIGVEYLYIKGLPYRQPVIIRDAEMANFIAATTSEQKMTFHSAGDDNLAHIVGRRVRIPHNDSWIEGELLTVRGSRYRRLRVRLQDCLVAYIDLTLPPTAIIETLD